MPYDDLFKFVQSLEEWFEYDSEANYWKCSNGRGKEIAIPWVEITDAGEEAAFRVLEERGYRWWYHEE